MVNPPIHPMSGLTAVVEKTLSDIEFLAKKEFDGKLKTNEGTLSVTGDLATLTASAGKDLYLAKAKVSVRLEANAVTEFSIVELKVNGVIKATWGVSLYGINIASAGSSSQNHEFVVSGLKVAATQVIKLEAVLVGPNTEVNGELVCFEEPTGGDPTI